MSDWRSGIDAICEEMLDGLTKPPAYDPSIHGYTIAEMMRLKDVGVSYATDFAKAKVRAGEWEAVEVTITRGNGSSGRATSYRPVTKSKAK